MNLMLNMKDISKDTLQMQIYKKKNVKKKPTFLRKHVSDAVGSLPVMPSLLPHGLREKSSLPVFCKCGEP